MQDVANTAAQAAEAGGKKSLKERGVSELEKYAVISAYLWILFALFGLHRQLQQGHGVSLWQQGFAIVNARRWQRSRPSEVARCVLVSFGRCR